MNFTILRPFWHRAGPVAEQSRAEPSRAEPSRAGTGRAKPGRAEPSRAGPSRATPRRAAPSRAGPRATRRRPTTADDRRPPTTLPLRGGGRQPNGTRYWIKVLLPHRTHQSGVPGVGPPKFFLGTRWIHQSRVLGRRLCDWPVLGRGELWWVTLVGDFGLWWVPGDFLFLVQTQAEVNLRNPCGRSSVFNDSSDFGPGSFLRAPDRRQDTLRR